MAKKDIPQLRPKQRLFIKEYLVDLNATQAAIRAGYSEKTANVIGPENLAKPCIAEAIQKELDNRAEKVEITAEQVLKDIVRIGDKAEGASKYNDALKAKELLGKHLKLFTDKIEHGLDSTAITTILNSLPKEFADKVIASLAKMRG